MAFQTGTQVNPQLGALDFSGFTNAANIQAASLAQLGETVGGAIKARKEKKEEKRLNKNAAALVFQLAESEPEIGEQLGITTLEDAATAVETLGGYKPTMSLIMEITANNRVFNPEILTVGEGDDAVNVIRTSAGQVQLIRDDNQKVPTSIQEREDEEQTLQDARKLYFEGVQSGSNDLIQQANDKITILGIHKDLLGNPLTAEEVFDPKEKPNNLLIFDANSLTGEDKEAYNFAINNPDNPNSELILIRLGAK